MRVFTEYQRFTQPLILIALSIAFIVASVLTFEDWNSVEPSNIGEQIFFLRAIIIISLVVVLFIFMKLETRVDEKGIYYQFFPFSFKLKLIPWNTIHKCHLRKYNAIFEYGGWGLKFSFSGKNGKAFTTKGSIGLQLILKNGKKILIGTQKKEELQRTLDTYNHKITNG